MKTVRIGEGFHAYPNGKRRDFTSGEELELANDFADLIVGKGLATEVNDPAPKGGVKTSPPAGEAKTDPETA